MTARCLLDLLDSEEVANALGCTADHINDLASRHQLPAVKFGRSWRFPISAMKEHLACLARKHLEGGKGSSAPASNAPGHNPPRSGKRKPLPDLAEASRS